MLTTTTPDLALGPGSVDRGESCPAGHQPRHRAGTQGSPVNAVVRPLCKQADALEGAGLGGSGSIAHVGVSPLPPPSRHRSHPCPQNGFQIGQECPTCLRGVIATRDIAEGETILSVPLSLAVRFRCACCPPSQPRRRPSAASLCALGMHTARPAPLLRPGRRRAGTKIRRSRRSMPTTCWTACTTTPPSTPPGPSSGSRTLAPTRCSLQRCAESARGWWSRGGGAGGLEVGAGWAATTAGFFLLRCGAEMLPPCSPLRHLVPPKQIYTDEQLEMLQTPELVGWCCRSLPPSQPASDCTCLPAPCGPVPASLPPLPLARLAPLRLANGI